MLNCVTNSVEGTEDRCNECNYYVNMKEWIQYLQAPPQLTEFEYQNGC